MKNAFEFKEFKIEQDLCAMKVGTDGVLLGAWSNIPDGDVLDVGCGSGLISLMIAQRNPNCKIDAIDIDKGAYLQSVKNIANSDWNARVIAHQISLQLFETTKKYKLIISNPPFFINAFKSSDNSKNIARHTDELPFIDFIKKAVMLMAEDGFICVVLPIVESLTFIEIAMNYKLFLNKKCLVKPNHAKDPKRVLLEFSFSENELVTSYLTIETKKRHHYTEEYRNLTQDFYLKF